MNCERCQAEFTPPKNVPTKRYCTKLCQQLCANEDRKLERRQASGAEGMEQVAFRRLRQPQTYDRPLKDSPQRTRVQRIELPAIAFEHRFLYQNGSSRPRLANKFVERQEEMRAAAVRTMVAMGEQQMEKAV